MPSLLRYEAEMSYILSMFSVIVLESLSYI